MRTRTIWIGVTALAAVGIAAALVGGGGGSGTSGEGAGTGDGRSTNGGVVTPTRRRPQIELAGEVLDEDGLPVMGATVYVLDKKKPGADRDKVDHEVTGPAGRWRLQTRKTVGTWIGVVAPGYRTALLDGDGVDPTKKIIHVITRSPALTVRVVDAEGKPVPSVGVQLEPWPPGGTYFCPGPLCRQGDQWAQTDGAGRCVLRQDVAAPVLVTPFIEGYHGRPASVWLPDAAGETTLVLHRNASLELALTAEGAPFVTDELVTLELLDGDTGAVVNAFTQPLDGPGRLRLANVLVPGTYHVKVAVPGRRPFLLRDVVVPEAEAGPGRVAGAVPPAAAADPGRLIVRLEGNTAARAPRGRRRAPLSFVQRLDGPWKGLGWQAGAPERFDRARQRLEFELQPGTYRLLVADVLTGRAAQEREVVVQAGEAAEVVLSMQLGQFGRLPAMQDGSVYVRALTTRELSGAALPVYGSSRDGRQRFSRGVDLIARKVRGEDVVVGPYPLDEFELVMRRSDGSTKTALYR